MQIKIQNNSLVVTTNIEVAKVREAKKFTPEALTVKDEKGNAVYKVAIISLEGDLKEFGATFNSVINNKLAFVKVFPFGVTEEEAKELVADVLGKGLAALAKYESVIVAQINEALAPIQAVMESIQVEGEQA